MGNNVTIRKAQPDDINEIINLCSEHAAFEKAEYSKEGKAEKLSRHLFGDTPSLYCLIAEEQGNILGYATYMTEFSTWDAGYYLHMDCLYLRPEARGKGIGEAMVQKLKQESKRLGCSLIQWQTPEFNTRAMKFYYRIGATSKNKVRFFLNINT